MSKAYGLPGLRVGWIASRDRAALSRLERAKHYTTICNSGPAEYLATLALRNGVTILEANRRLIESNDQAMAVFLDQYPGLFEYEAPAGGCISFPRYLGDEGVETFCQRAVEEHGVLLLPASIYRSSLVDVPTDRFRVGIGRRDVPHSLRVLGEGLEGQMTQAER